MVGLGTMINAGAIVAGGLLGLLVGKAIQERFRKIVTVALGLSTFFMGIAGTLEKMLVAEGGSLSTRGTFMMIFSLVLGGVLGELCNIDGGMERFGVWLREKTGSAKDKGFVDAFVTSSFTVCIGAMAVIGSLNDGMHADPTILITKGILDFAIILVMTASMGKGCIFSAIPVAVFQGSVTLLATVIAPLMNDAATDNLSLVGSVLIACIGVNLLAEGKFRIKVANLLPAILFAVAAAYIPFL